VVFNVQQRLLILHHALLELPCMVHLANAAMHSLNQLLIHAQVVGLFLEQLVL
jgi:hypothetical protein